MKMKKAPLSEHFYTALDRTSVALDYSLESLNDCLDDSLDAYAVTLLHQAQAILHEMYQHLGKKWTEQLEIEERLTKKQSKQQKKRAKLAM